MREPWDIIKRPLVTEKNMARVEKRRRYTFEVAHYAAKPEIKKAVEALFNVTVIDVHTMIHKGLDRRVGYSKVHDANTKKAVVQLKEGDKIDIV